MEATIVGTMDWKYSIIISQNISLDLKMPQLEYEIKILVGSVLLAKSKALELNDI